jgi:hypothetical protein
MHPVVRSVLVAAIALAVALYWTFAFAKALRRAKIRVALRLDEEGLHLEEGERRTDVPWGVVDAVEVDEDRLVVRVVRRGDDPLVVEPIWRGTSVYALADAVRAARDAARSGRKEPRDEGSADPAARR